MDTLYTNHIRHPHLLHANVRATRYLDHQKWRFQNNNGKYEMDGLINQVLT